MSALLCFQRNLSRQSCLGPRCKEALTSPNRPQWIRPAQPHLDWKQETLDHQREIKQEFEDHTDPKPKRKLLLKMVTAGRCRWKRLLVCYPPCQNSRFSLVGYPLTSAFVGSPSCRHPARHGYSTVDLPKLCYLQECRGTYEPQNHHSVWYAKNLLSKLMPAKQRHHP